MKTTKLLTWMLACLMAATMTSCLGSDDDDNAKKTLSKSEIHQCYLQMSGDHSGKMYFTKSTLEYNKLDSVDVTWTVKSDSTMTVHNVPVKALTSMLTKDDLKEVLNAKEDIDIELFYAIDNASPIEFMILPVSTKIPIFYAEQTRDANFTWIINSYSWGQLSAGKMRMQLVLYSVTLDSSSASFLSGQSPIVIVEK